MLCIDSIHAFGVIVTHEFKSIRKLPEISFLSALRKQKNTKPKGLVFFCLAGQLVSRTRPPRSVSEAGILLPLPKPKPNGFGFSFLLTPTQFWRLYGQIKCGVFDRVCAIAEHGLSPHFCANRGLNSPVSPNVCREIVTEYSVPDYDIQEVCFRSIKAVTIYICKL